MSASPSDNVESISESISDASGDSIGGKYSTDSNKQDHELLPLEKGKSRVWEYFGFPAENYDFLMEQDKKERTAVYCKLCPKKMNYQGNTTNVMMHLQYNHRAEYLKVKAKPGSKR